MFLVGNNNLMTIKHGMMNAALSRSPNWSDFTNPPSPPMRI
jgi:hypothetical protein